MQHPDEGTIHAWIDGALSTDEAARIEAHVNKCPQCAAAVAEARGFIAASSRILTALDNVPTGVVPVVTRNARTRNWMYWRAAAAVLVIAVGTVVVRREQTSTPQTAMVVPRADTSPYIASPAAVAAQKPVTPPSVMPSAAPSAVEGTSPPAVTSRTSEMPVATSQPKTTPKSAASRSSVSGEVHGVEISGDKPTEAASPTAQRGASAPQSANAGVALDAVAFAPSQVRALGAQRAIGGNRTTYEIAPGDTVVLIESPPNLAQTVVTGVPTTVAGVAGQTVITGAAAAARTTVRRSTGAAGGTTNPQQAQGPPPAPSPAPKQSATPKVDGSANVDSTSVNGNKVNTIAWTDPATGHSMELSGHHTRAELEAIKQRIERARAAAAAQRKNP